MQTIEAYTSIVYKAYHLEKDRKISKQLNEMVHILNGMKKRNTQFLENQTLREVLDRLTKLIQEKAYSAKTLIDVKSELLRILRKEYHLISQGYMASLYMMYGIFLGTLLGLVVGLIVFGTPLYVGFGLLIGMVAGMFIGGSADKKAEVEDRVIDKA